VDTPVSTGKTSTSAQRDLTGTLRTQGPRSSMGQDSYGFCLHLELTLYHSSPNPPRENWLPASTDTQACRRDKQQSETARPANTRDNQLVRGKSKNVSNRNQGYLASSKPSSFTMVSLGYQNTPEKQDFDLKSHFTMMIEHFKKVINNSLKEIQKNTGKQLEALKKETQKSLTEVQENTTEQVKELNKTIQDLKMEIEIIKKSQRETTLEIVNLGEKSRVIDASITNRIQEIEERFSDVEDTIEDIDTIVKENVKCRKLLTPQNTGNQGYNEKTKLKDSRYRRE
jgi:chromosome segregation ATPase